MNPQKSRHETNLLNARLTNPRVDINEMTTNIYRSLLLASLALLLGSCYQDLGNNVYDESIEDIEVSMPSRFRTRKPFVASTYEITPEITTKSGARHELEYQWYINPNTATRGKEKGTLAGTDPTLTIKLDPNDPEHPIPDVYHIRLYVTDKTNGTVTLRNTQLDLSNPYTYAWVVLHAQDGHAELGTVEYDDGKMVNSPRAYSEETGKTLMGEPVAIGVRQDDFTDGGFKKSYLSQLYVVTTDLNSSGLFLPTEGFRLVSPWSGLISKTQIADFDPRDVTFGFGNNGMFVASKGNVFVNSAYGAAFYKLTPSEEELPGSVYIDGVGISAQAGVGYDSASHRFVKLEASPYGGWQSMVASDIPPTVLPMSKIRADEDNTVEPTGIPEGYKLVSMFDGYNYLNSGRMSWAAFMIYAYMIDDAESHVYTIRGREVNIEKSDKDAPMGQVFTFPRPESINENTLMTTGAKYAYILFYADGNTVYRHDLATGKCVPIYTHDTPGATVTALRMAAQGYYMSDQSGEAQQRYGHPFGQTLGVGFSIGESAGELVVLHLDNTGALESDSKKYPGIQVFKGYGPIKDIGFI